jgi:hypothetical protein
MSLTPTEKLNFRTKLAAYLRTAEAYQSVWHYSENRPFRGYGVSPSQPHIADCSGYASLSFWWAGHLSGHPVNDPLNAHYSGWGNTDTAYAWLIQHGAGGNWFIGDMAIYGTPFKTVHMVICRVNAKDRSETTKYWSSNGEESAPEFVSLSEGPAPLVGVFRHPALA